MSTHESTPLLPPSHSAPNQEQSTSHSNPLGNAPAADASPVKTSNEKKVPTKKVATKAGPSRSAGAPTTQRARRRYEPYRKPDPAPELEGNLQADPDELEALDATAKMLYKSDREVLEYIELIRRRTAAVLEHVTRNGSQLRSCRGAMERIESFVGQWQAIGSEWTAEQLAEDSDEGDDEGEDEEDDEDDDYDENEAPRNLDLFPTIVRGESGAFQTVEEHPLSNLGHPDFPYTNTHDTLGDSAHQSPSGHAGEALFGRRIPLAELPSFPPFHDDRNDLEYAEDEIEVRSDFPIPPDHAGLASEDSTFNRFGVDLRIASDTGMLFPPSENELARISKEFEREASMGTSTAIATKPLGSPFHSHHPLMQSYVPSSPEPVRPSEPRHLVTPRPVLRTPSPSRTVFCRKRKRAPDSDDEDDDTGNIVGPSATIVRNNNVVPGQVETKEKDDGVPAKRRRLTSQQSTWDSPFVEAGDDVLQPPRADARTHESPPAPQSRPEHEQFSLPPAQTSQLQREDSESERSEVIEMLSQAVEQGGPEDEERFPSAGGSQYLLPDLTADNSQTTSANNTRPGMEIPAEFQLLAGIPTDTPSDVFGPIILSVKANKITEKSPARDFQNDGDADVATPDSEDEATKISSKSARFSLASSDEEREHKVFRKTPVKPRRSLRTIEAENVLAAEVESQDTINPLPSPKKKRATGTRARKTKATSVKLEPIINPGGDLPSISASEPPVLRRGRSASVRPKIAALPKAPVRKSTRGRR